MGGEREGWMGGERERGLDRESERARERERDTLLEVSNSKINNKEIQRKKNHKK